MRFLQCFFKRITNNDWDLNFYLIYIFLQLSLNIENNSLFKYVHDYVTGRLYFLKNYLIVMQKFLYWVNL